MALKGDLASVDLAQVFQMLALNQKVGMLSIQGSTCWKALYFDHRGVTLYFNEHRVLDRVLATMVRFGQLDAEHVLEAREHAASQGISVVDSLLAGGFAEEGELEVAFRHEIEEEIYDLFFWTDAGFEFFEGATGFEGREGAINERFFFSTDTLIMEAARRIDEWSYIQERVSTVDMVFRTVEDPPNVLELEDAALSVYDLVDGKRNVERLIEVTALSAFHVHKALAQMLDEDLIEELAPEELTIAAADCVEEGRLPDAINLYERAIAVEEGLPNTHALVASTYEATEQYELAAYHLKCVAEHHASVGATVQAVDLLRHVIEMLPTDLATRERLVELTVGVPEFRHDGSDAVAEGKTLVDLYLELGEVERVRSILERLLRDNPDDIELKKSLINVHSKAGDTKRVIELYQSIAEDEARRGNPIEAVKYLQKILMIDRGRKDISDRIRSLYELDERRRSRRRSLVVLGVLFCIIAACGGAWYVYEQRAREQFDAIKVTDLLDAGSFDQAAAVYEQFLAEHPLTLVARDARAALARVESLRVAHQAKLKQDEIRREAERQELRTQYREQWRMYDAALQVQDIGKALRHLDRCHDLVLRAGAPEDKQWAAKVELSRIRSELQSLLGEAAALARSARELMAKGDWRRARSSLLDLVTRYETTEFAAGVQLPVLLTSKPAGAAILAGGKRVAGTDGKPVVTPAVVLCDPDGISEFDLQLDGFATLTVKVSPRETEESASVLTVLPALRIELGGPAHTGAGVGEGALAVGLRGGRLGIAPEGTAIRSKVQLSELREVRGTPVLSRGRVVFATNQTELVCRRLPDGAEAWVTKLESTPTEEPDVQDGRVLVADVDGHVVCLELDRGQVLWRNKVPGGVTGHPVVYRRLVRVGTPDGQLLVFDALNGNLVRHHKGLPGFSSSPLLLQGAVLFGTVDGRIAAANEITGRLVWSKKIGRAVRDGELCLANGTLLVLGDGKLLKLDLQDGSVQAERAIESRVTSGPVYASGKAYLTVREEITGGHRDALLALDAETFEVVWEYRDGGKFRGPLTTDGKSIYLPDSKSAVLRFD